MSLMCFAKLAGQVERRLLCKWFVWYERLKEEVKSVEVNAHVLLFDCRSFPSIYRINNNDEEEDLDLLAVRYLRHYILFDPKSAQAPLKKE
jgi:hypothetical protein